MFLLASMPATSSLLSLPTTTIYDITDSSNYKYTDLLIEALDAQVIFTETQGIWRYMPTPPEEAGRVTINGQATNIALHFMRHPKGAMVDCCIEVRAGSCSCTKLSMSAIPIAGRDFSSICDMLHSLSHFHLLHLAPPSQSVSFHPFVETSDICYQM